MRPLTTGFLKSYTFFLKERIFNSLSSTNAEKYTGVKKNSPQAVVRQLLRISGTTFIQQSY